MRALALAVLIGLCNPPSCLATSNENAETKTVTKVNVSAEAQKAARASARIGTRQRKVGTEGGTKVNGERSKPVGAAMVCEGSDEIAPDYSNSQDTKLVIETDPVTGLQTTHEVVVRRWILVLVTCGGSQYSVRRCTFGDCPVGTEYGIDTYPDINLVIDEARDTADYEIPDAILSPAIKPGKAPIPGVPLFFAVSESQWNRSVTAHATACNGVLCVYGRVDAKVVGMEFSPGDGGSPVLCTTPGVVVRSADAYRAASRKCSYVYQTAGTHQGSLSLLYDATVSGGIVGQPPSIVRPTERVVIEADLAVPVSEFQPVIIK